MIRRHSLRFVFGLIFLLTQVHTASSQERPASTPSAEDGDIAMLREIEDRVLPLPLVSGIPRHESLTDYYWETNVELRRRFDEAYKAFNSGKPRRFRAMTMVAGSAGVGKTFVKRGIYRDSVPDDQIWKFDIRELFEEMSKQGLAARKPDVSHRKQAISELLSLTPEGRDEFHRMLAERSPAFVVADSLDEVHTDDYFFVLSELEKFALNGNRDFVHLVVFGRPLAFRDYWRVRSSEGMPEGLRGFQLNPPDFRTTGDLLVSSWNYDCWKHNLSREGLNGETHPMSLPDYEKWHKCDFQTKAEFSDVRFDENRSICPAVRDELYQWATNHRVVGSALSNLAGNSMVREMVEEHVEAGRDFDERRFMADFFAKWLARNTRSGNRPSRDKPAMLDVYVRLLEAVAAKYVAEDRVDRLGYFDVLKNDHVVVESDGQSISVPVITLMNHSGLVATDPLLPTAPRYRFEPLWIHRFLLERRTERESTEAAKRIVSSK